MWISAKSVGLVVAMIGALLPLASIGGNDAASPGTNAGEIFMLSLESPTLEDALPDLGIGILVDYDNGLYLVQGRMPDLVPMRGMGISAWEIPDRTVLAFPDSGYSFDTRAGTPDLPPNLVSPGTPERIIQFIGPIKSEWVAAVEAIGVSMGEYVDSYAFLAMMSDSQAEAVRLLPFVNWIGVYEAAYKIQSGLLSMTGIVPINVIAHDGVDEARLRSVLEGFGAYVTATWTMPVTAEAEIHASFIPAIARSPDVLSISFSPEKEPLDWAAGEIHHFHDAWMSLRSGIPWNLTGRSPGPDGIEGTPDDVFEVVGIQDTGFDRNDPVTGWTDLFNGPLGDRVIALRRRTAPCTQPDGRAAGLAHGTHVVGTVLSNGYGWEVQNGEPTDDFVWDKSEAGVVPEGMLSFDCIIAGSGGLQVSPAYWDDQYADGAKTASNSWGSVPGGYGAVSNAIDFRIDALNDRMMVFAAGNDGPEPATVITEAKAKNGLTVGASQNFRPNRAGSDNPNLVADFSSRGNPNERIKPDLVTVGTSVISGLGYGEWLYYIWEGGNIFQSDYIMDVDQYDYRTPGVGQDGIPDYRYYSGTSASAPHAAGLYMLTREYFREAYGIDNVNSQLAKAMLINGAVRMDPSLYEYPGIDQGWGRIDLEQSLFPPAPRSNQWEEGMLATTGIWSPYGINMNVMSSDVPLKVTLVWIDSPSYALVRNLDLQVRDPTGTVEYHGNQYAKSGALKGWTDPSDGDYDVVNNVEQVEVLNPVPGKWSIEVRGVSIPTTAKFALVFSADVGPVREHQVSLSTDYPTEIVVSPGGTAVFPFTVMNFGTLNDTVNISDDAPAELSVAYDWDSAQLASTQEIDNLALFTAPSDAPSGIHSFVICGISQDDPTVPPASDCISIRIAIVATQLPPTYDITAGDGDEMDPSILTFTSGAINHIFVAYKKIGALNYSDMRRGGTNVWVAHNTLNDSHMPNGTWTHELVSDWNDAPNNLRMLQIGNGTFKDRVVLTWSGEDPTEPNEEQRPYGRIAFSDPPYTDWSLRTIQKNYGSNMHNSVRNSFPVFRNAGGPNGTLVWIWEHVDKTSHDALQVSAVQTHAAFSWDGGDSWGACLGPGDPNNRCYRVAPPNSTTNFYFFPDGVVDQNDVLWIFFYWRSAGVSDTRRLAAVLWDGPTWQTGWTAAINVWDPGSGINLRFPAVASSPEGGNRVYVAVTRNQGDRNDSIYTLYAEGDFGSGLVYPMPAPAPLNGISSDFSSPQGPMGTSVLTARYEKGPVLNMVHTDDGLTWIPYVEDVPLLGGGADLLTWFSPDGFADRDVEIVTEDAYAKGHQMSDTLTIGPDSCVYEVWHESRERFERADYGIRLTVYCDGWQSLNDTIGPTVRNPLVIPNPYDKRSSSSLKVVAQITDYSSGFSNITAADLVPTDTTVDDPALVDWANAWTMNLTGYDRSPVETAWLWANDTAAGWPVGSCHRFWLRGRDSKGNWGSGEHVDVCVIAPPPVPRPAAMKPAVLTGVAYEDITLAWSKSPDDGGGSNVVTDYKILKSSRMQGPFSLVTNVAAIGSPGYSWTDAGAGHGNPDNSFYYIVANSSAHDSVPSRFAAKFSRTMDGGKQLVSFPMEQADHDPAIVFQTFGYTYVRTYVAGTPNPWWCHKPGRFVSSLTQLSVEQGYWVELDGPGTMTVAGLVPNDLVMTLRSGWNMIGFPSFRESYTFADLNAAIGGSLQLVEMYDATAGPYYMQKIHRNAWAATYLIPGHAYMIRVSSDVGWAVPTV